MESIPPEQAERLVRLLRTGSITAIKALAEELAQDGVRPLLAARIGALADVFDLSGLRRLAEGLEIGP